MGTKVAALLLATMATLAASHEDPCCFSTGPFPFRQGVPIPKSSIGSDPACAMWYTDPKMTTPEYCQKKCQAVPGCDVFILTKFTAESGKELYNCVFWKGDAWKNTPANKWMQMPNQNPTWGPREGCLTLVPWDVVIKSA